MALNFRKVESQNKYYKLDECEAGQVLVTGRFIGEEQGRFGPQFAFKELESQEKVVLSGGHLAFLLGKEGLLGLSKGDNMPICRVTYAGSQILVKGPFKGKPAHTFELEIAEDESNGSSEEANEEEDNESPKGKNGTGKASSKKESNPWDDEEEASPKKEVKTKASTKKPVVVEDDEEEEEEEIQVVKKKTTKKVVKKAPAAEVFEGEDFDL